MPKFNEVNQISSLLDKANAESKLIKEKYDVVHSKQQNAEKQNIALMSEINILNYTKNSLQQLISQLKENLERKEKYYENIISIQQKEIYRLLVEKKSPVSYSELSNHMAIVPSSTIIINEEDKLNTFTTQQELKEWIENIRKTKEEPMPHVANSVISLSRASSLTSYARKSTPTIYIPAQEKEEAGRVMISEYVQLETQSKLIEMQLQYFTKELQYANNRIASMEKTHSKLKGQNIELSAQIECINNDKSNEIEYIHQKYNAEANTLKQRIESYRTQKNSDTLMLKLKYESTHKAVEYFKTLNTQLNECSKSKEESYSTILTSIEQKNALIEKYSMQVAQLTQKYDNATETLEKITKQYNIIISSAITNGGNTSKEIYIENYHSTIAAYKASFQQLQTQKEKDMETIESLKSMANSKKEDDKHKQLCEQLSNQNNLLKKEIQNIEQARKELQTKLDSVLTQYNKSILEFSQANEQNEKTFCEKLQNLQESNLRLSNELFELKTKGMEAGSQVLPSKFLSYIHFPTLDLYKFMNNIGNVEMEQLKSSIIMQNNEIESYAAQKNDLIKAYQNQITHSNTAIQSLNNEVTQLRTASAIKSREIESNTNFNAVDVLKNENIKLANNNMELSGQLRDSMKSNICLEKEVINLRSCMKSNNSVDIVCYLNS